jgi:hypothetical protein
MATSRLRVTKAGLAGVLGAAAVCSASPASAAALPLLNAVAAPSAPNIIANGSFALPNEGQDAVNEFYTPAEYKADKEPVKTIPRWVVGSAATATPGGVQLNLDYIDPPPGSLQNVILCQSGPGTISQSVTTVPGATYLLSWYGAAEPNGGSQPLPDTMHVVWGSKVVAAPTYKTAEAAPGWKVEHVVVTAASTSSTVEFADATTPVTAYCSMVGNVSLAGDLNLYLPTVTTVAPTGQVLAIVRTATGNPVVDPSLTVKLYGTYTETSYAPPVTVLMAEGSVRSGQAVLKLHLHAAMAGHTIPAYATLTGPGFTPRTDHLKIKVS